MSDPHSTIDSLQNSYGTNWTPEYVSTINEWISMGTYHINLLDIAIKNYQYILRSNAITVIMLSSLTGILSVTQFGTLQVSPIYTNITAGIFATFSFTVAIFGGYMKVYQIQENLELYIRLKQEWLTFTTKLLSELQLPIELRRDAKFTIIKNRDKYIELLKTNIDVPSSYRVKARKQVTSELDMESSGITLCHVAVSIGGNEVKKTKLRATLAPINFQNTAAAPVAPVIPVASDDTLHIPDKTVPTTTKVEENQYIVNDMNVTVLHGGPDHR